MIGISLCAAVFQSSFSPVTCYTYHAAMPTTRVVFHTGNIISSISRDCPAESSNTSCFKSCDSSADATINVTNPQQEDSDGKDWKHDSPLGT